MNRIDRLFKNKNRDILSMYYTAGYPSIDDTLTIARAVEEAGADMIEIGMPFSDPVADGPVIQRCANAALTNGMTLKRLFLQLADLRGRIAIPVVLMGYFNPIMQYGIDRFLNACATCGVDGFIIPDWPVEMFQRTYSDQCRTMELSAIFLVTPQTSDQRVRVIDRISSGFVYAVSSYGVTGQTTLHANTLAYLSRLQSLNLQNPVLVGFGVRQSSDIEQFRLHVSGVIVGSAFLENLSPRNPAESAQQFIHSLRHTL